MLASPATTRLAHYCVGHYYEYRRLTSTSTHHHSSLDLWQNFENTRVRHGPRRRSFQNWSEVFVHIRKFRRKTGLTHDAATSRGDIIVVLTWPFDQRW